VTPDDVTNRLLLLCRAAGCIHKSRAVTPSGDSETVSMTNGNERMHERSARANPADTHAPL
jgi:hypothetical protein